MYRLLITGCNGLLGQKLMDAVTRPESFPSPLPDVEQFECLFTSVEDHPFAHQEEIQYRRMDITDRELVRTVMDDFRPDILLHTAAMTHVDLCETEPGLCHNINVEAVRILAEACGRWKTKFIHLSTDFVFDGTDGPYSEDDPPNPLSVYSRSKLESERILQGSDISWCILRTCILYGVGINLVRKNIVLWLKEELESQRVVRVVHDQYRSPTLAEDLASGCLLAACKQAAGIFNMSGRDVMSIYEMAKRLAVHYGFDPSLIQPISSEMLNQAAKRPPKTGLILNKAISELGYSPHKFEDALEVIHAQLST